MNLGDAAALDRLAAHLAPVFGADRVGLADVRLMAGGAIQQNWALGLEIIGGPRSGVMDVVLRTNSPTRVATSHGRVEEFTLLKAAWDVGVSVPEPIQAFADPTVLGKPFALMHRVDGTAVGSRITEDPGLGGDPEALVERLGRELARVHTISPSTHEFDFLASPARDPALSELARMRRHLDQLGEPRPVLEWAIRWLYRNRPIPDEVVLVHHDFRTGNYLVDNDGLTAILDWEFADWSDPHEDLGWFCAACWRFSRRDREAGGVGSRESFYRGYEDESGRQIDHARVQYWEVFAHLRWAVIAMQQRARYVTGGERTLDLGLTGLRLPEIEFELLRMTDPKGSLR